MAWLVGLAIIIAVIWLMVVSPTFRYVALAVLVISGLGIWWGIKNNLQQNERARQAEYERRVAKFSAIKPEQLELSEVYFLPNDLIGEDATYKFMVTVKNNSGLPVSYMSFSIALRDCAKPQECETVGETSIWFGESYDYNQNKTIIPAGQKRAFETTAWFKNLPKAREGVLRTYSSHLESVAAP